MAGLLSLANELILQISDQLDRRKAFRSTCRRINLLVFPRLMSRMLIDISGENPDGGISQLEALATGSTHAAQHVRTLIIRRLLPSNLRSLERKDNELNDKRDWAEEKMREFLPAALSALAGATTVMYKMNIADLGWATSLVCEYLATLPALRTLDLGTIYICPEFQLCISNLNKLVVETDYNISTITEIIGNSPNLTELDHYCPTSLSSELPIAIPSLHRLLSKVPHERPLRLRHLGLSGHHSARLDHETIPHLRHLQSLELSYGIPPLPDWHSASYADFWAAVSREKIPVEAVISPLDGAVLEYLAVATGIKKLSIFGAISTAFYRQFFHNILPRHAKTLVSLTISADNGPWCFGGHNAHPLFECTQLTKLAITIASTSSGTAEDQKENMRKTVHHVMKITTVLPNLYRLRLLPAEQTGVLRRERVMGSLRKGAHGRGSDALHALIVSYPLFKPALFPQVVKIGDKKYQPQSRPNGLTRYAVQER